MGFSKATKKKAKLRAALCGTSGSGKTYSALKIASFIGKRIAVIDTEHGSASKYADKFEFDTCDDLEDFSPKSYIEAIQQAVDAGYDVLVIDSLTHAWAGKGGALEMVDAAAAKSQGNSFAAWRNVTPWHNKLVEAILSAPLHIIATMRTKADYVLEEGKNGKKVPKKVGMAPIQRDGMEYEFDIVGDLDINHTLTVSKTRCEAVDGKQYQLPGKEFAETLRKWLDDGVAAEPKAAAPKNEQPKEQAKKLNGDVAGILQKFADILVAQDEVEASMGCKCEDWTEDHKVALRKFYSERKKAFEESQIPEGVAE